MSDPELAEDADGDVVRIDLHVHLVVPVRAEDCGNGPRAERAWVSRLSSYLADEDGKLLCLTSELRTLPYWQRTILDGKVKIGDYMAANRPSRGDEP